MVALAALASPMAFTSCTDSVKFGDAFLDKAPGGDISEDTVFSSPVYTKQFLNAIYRKQYYGLTVGTGNAHCNSGWTGKFEALTDCFALYYSSAVPWKLYYTGSKQPNSESMMDFNLDYVWEAVRACYKLLEHLDNVPGLTEQERVSMRAQAKCLIAARYFDLFPFYGGLPLVTGSYSGLDDSYDLPRATAEQTVEFMVKLLDEAIAAPDADFPWAYDETTLQTEAGHWTKAGAMALKARILQFAASPLFNSDQGFYGGSSEAEQKLLVWYGGYKEEYWTRFKDACKAFLDKLDSEGGYELVEAMGTRPQDYRLAFRTAYFDEGSTEIIHSVHFINKAGSTYNWYSWISNGRSVYSVTQEYVNMFPWSDGTPFDWDKTEAEGKLDQMFVVGDSVKGKPLLQNVRLTRDPRLYETVVVNNSLPTLDWTTAAMTGTPNELWVGGSTAALNADQETGKYATGYRCLKYSFDEYSGHGLQWATIRLSDVYLMYAEALIQTNTSGDFTEAISWIDKVRARVGLKGLAECNPDKDLKHDKQLLLKELLRERACELGFENARYMDMVRYKLKDDFEKPLHGLRLRRLVKNPTTGEFEVCDMQWYKATKGQTFTCSDGTKVKISYKDGVQQPTVFQYEVFELQKGKRIWWTQGFDPKWYLTPFKTTEINKGYGLVQNPGW
jgi:starch-binding outer membrane protein, SusD/RagB family